MPVKTKIKKVRNFRSLTVTLAIAFLTLSAVVLLNVSSSDMYFNFQNQRKLVTGQQRLIAQDAADTVKSFIQEKFSILEAAASLGSLAALSQEEQKPVLEKLLGLEPAFRQLVLLNAQEEELLRVSRLSKLLSVQLMEYNKSELFPKASQKGTYISYIYIDKVTSEPMVVMTVPVTDVFGDFKGVLMAEVNLKFMWDLVDSIKVGDNGLAYVVDGQGNLIAFGDISRVLRGENLVQLSEVNEFVNGDESTHKSAAYVSKGIQNTYVVASHVPLGRPNWAVVVELPVWEAYETVILALKRTAWTMLLSFVLAIIVGIYLSKRITKPIIDLRDAARKIGEGNMGTRIKVKSKDEIGQLATSFNQMVEDLNKTTVSRDSLMKEVAERKKAEQHQAQLLEQLKKTNQELKDFAHIVSHDLKAPLRGINTLANWISTDYADKLDDDGKEQMNLLMSRVDQMHNLIEGVLQYSRVGRIKEEKVVVNLNELVTEVIDMIAPPENISIIVENELPTIECEQTRIMQVFENLLSNAVKYMDKPQGQIKVGCIEENGFWKFRVADNGPGIEEKHFERIFKIFQTLSPQDEAESTGVGLSVVKKIVEMYEGTVWVKSEVGNGSTFFFTLPKTLSAPVVVVT